MSATFKTPANRHCAAPDRCSVCLGAAPRVVTVVDGHVLVDGVPLRPAQPESFGAHRNTEAGARRRARRRR